MIDPELRVDAYEATEPLTYQVALRTLGAWLDSQGVTADIRVLESIDGFLVQQVSASSTGLQWSRTISFDEVWELVEDKKLRRRARDRDGGYQNLLRAVGHELDQAGARSILVEQVGNEILLTYIYARFEGGYSVAKHFTMISSEGRRDLLLTARARRRPGKLAQGFLRLLAES